MQRTSLAHDEVMLNDVVGMEVAVMAHLTPINTSDACAGGVSG